MRARISIFCCRFRFEWENFIDIFTRGIKTVERILLREI